MDGESALLSCGGYRLVEVRYVPWLATLACDDEVVAHGAADLFRLCGTGIRRQKVIGRFLQLFGAAGEVPDGPRLPG